MNTADLVSGFIAYLASLLAIMLCLTFAFKYEDKILGLGTIVLAIATIFLAVEAHRQTTVTNEALTSVQRAFVVFKDITYGKLPDYRATDPTGIRLIFAWENSGTTPTKCLVTHMSWALFTPDIPSNYDFPDFGAGDSRSLIGPKSTSNMMAIDVPIDTFRSVQAGTHRLYTWGWADYNDIFNGTERHRTEVSAETLVTGNLNDVVPGLTFVVLPRFNGADSETMKKPKPCPPELVSNVR
jgi:hypothetical protein